jgi:hypothetical protein
VVSVQLCKLISKESANVPSPQIDRAWKLTSDSGLDESQTKAVISALNFILTTATKHHTEAARLTTSSLSLPKENSDAIARAYKANYLAMAEVPKLTLHVKSRQCLELLQWTGT